MEAQQVRRLFLLLVVVVCIFHSQQTMWFESEAQLRLENQCPRDTKCEYQNDSKGCTDLCYAMPTALKNDDIRTQIM